MTQPSFSLHRKNNFDFLRLLLALFVIISHSYALAGIRECDLLCQISNEQISFSFLGVKGFFVISGFLIFQSYQRSKSFIDYFWKRVLRLFPALIVVTLLTVLLAPIVYEGTLPLYKNKSYLWYIPKSLSLYKGSHYIDGIFENNPFKKSINGSLWTIPYEFTSYIFLSALFLFRKKVKVTLVLVTIIYVALVLTNGFFYEALRPHGFIVNFGLMLDLGAYFAAGVLLSAHGFENLPYKKGILLLTFLILWASIFFQFFGIVQHIILPPFFILAAIIPVKMFYKFTDKIGDLSYGIYIYAFPVQQTLMYYFGFNYMELMLYSTILSIFFGYLSWHLVEKRALKLKSKNPIKLLGLSNLGEKFFKSSY